MKKMILISALSIMSFLAQAQDVTVTNAWTRTTLINQPVTGVFLVLKAKTHSHLVGVKTSVAKDAQIHEMKMEGDIMKMREMTSLDLPAGQEVSLAPGTYHIMLLGMKRQLKLGETIPLELTVINEKQKKEIIKVDVPVGNEKK